MGRAYIGVGRYEEDIASHKKALQRAPNVMFLPMLSLQAPIAAQAS